MNFNLFKGIIFTLLILGSVFLGSKFVFADNIDELRNQIEEKTKKLEELEKEIQKQRNLLNNTSGQAKTLESTVNQLEASRRKILSDIDYTETQIEKAELTINKLSIEINNKEEKILESSKALAESVRRTNELESTSLIERFLGYESVSDFWNELHQTVKIQKQLHNVVDELVELYTDLRNVESEKKVEYENLSSYKIELASEQEAVEYTKKEKEVILAQTKNKEAEYQKLLEQKLSEKREFEEELLEIESKLRLLDGTEQYPNARNGILTWPLDTIRVTQEFGGTAFAKQNPGVYGRPYHPGTDFGVPIGTKVYAVENGTVIGIDNTDWYPGCRAWGGWILIEHENGLSSLYAHLSSFSVKVGDKVSRGQIIGLSGNSGISTGPHLHLSLYISDGVEVGKYGSYKSGTGCAATNASGPFADLDAYLDPMEYLPSL